MKFCLFILIPITPEQSSFEILFFQYIYKDQ